MKSLFAQEPWFPLKVGSIQGNNLQNKAKTKSSGYPLVRTKVRDVYKHLFWILMALESSHICTDPLARLRVCECLFEQEWTTIKKKIEWALYSQPKHMLFKTIIFILATIATNIGVGQHALHQRKNMQIHYCIRCTNFFWSCMIIFLYQEET